jgi:hypothetical protein
MLPQRACSRFTCLRLLNCCVRDNARMQTPVARTTGTTVTVKDLFQVAWRCLAVELSRLSE